MDVNEFMKKSLENQAQHTSLLERIAEGIEDLVAKGIHVASFTLPENFDLKAVGNVIHATGGTVVQDNQAGAADTSAEDEAEAKRKADEKAAADKKAKEEATAKAAAEKKAKEEADAKAKADAEKKDEGKKYTADDARKALKAFAAIEGNDAAMALLESLEVASVSELAEKGSDAIAELIKKAGGK